MRLTYLTLVGAPLAAALLAAMVGRYRSWVGAAGALLSTLSLAAALRLAGQVLAGATPTWGPSEMMRVDALSALLAVCVSFVAALAAWLGPGLGRHERSRERRADEGQIGQTHARSLIGSAGSAARRRCSRRSPGCDRWRSA